MNQSPILAVNHTLLWLKVGLSVATLVLLYSRYRKGKAADASSRPYSLLARAMIVLTVVFSFAVFHNLGAPRSGGFVQYADMLHYYLGTKYFKEIGYSDLYNAVIVADAEQGDQLARLPFYTDLRTYQNTLRPTALLDADR